MTANPAEQIPIQPVERPILSSPYQEPPEHWVYDTSTGEAKKMTGRRPASYWYKSHRSYNNQQMMLAGFAEEIREDLPLVNALRRDIRRWRESKYEGATEISKELLRYWQREDRQRRLFFCQIEAVETVIYLNEIWLANRRPRFKSAMEGLDLEVLKDTPADPTLAALTRLGLKMATGSGKTVVMAMLAAWTFCNRARVPSDERFPSAVLVVCPNLTIKERLQVLRPENENNYYTAFDLAPARLRESLSRGKVFITNWHLFAPESEHAEGGKTYAVVNKGEESPEAFAKRVLGDLSERGKILVFNDEAHHAWRPRLMLDNGERSTTQSEEVEEATVWVNGLDTINKAVGIRFCVDLSATPFYIGGSGYTEGAPFPWLVSDFGLVDAIESGIVKIPRLPVSDTTGQPEAQYFRLWKHVNDQLQPGEKGSRTRRPKPDAIYREAEPALNTLAGQWVQRFKQVQEASNAQDRTPPVMIIICDNTDIAEVFYRHISGEDVIEVIADEPNPDTSDDEEEAEETEKQPARGKKPKTKVVYGTGSVFPEYFSNRPGFTPTIRIDSKLLAQAESEDPNTSRLEAARLLREVVSTVGKQGQPGEQVRCVISVAMLNEGWDANNVTHIFGLRAFDSQLLCEQVVGRGLRRMDYTPDPATRWLTEEYVDIYGVPFSLIPFKGRDTKQAAPEDRIKNHVRALPERSAYEIRFPNVEGYVFALKHNLITADVSKITPLAIEPEIEPTSVFVKPRVGYKVGASNLSGPGEFEEQNREAYYNTTHLQTIEFEIARQIVQLMVGDHQQDIHPASNSDPRLRLQSRHQLFPQVLRIVHEYVSSRISFRGVDPRELGQQKYFQRVVERLLTAIRPDDRQGEAPLLPILNRYIPISSTAGVDFKTTKPVFMTQFSHINAVAADTARWEQSAAFRLEQAANQGVVSCYARNDQMGFTIPYEFLGGSHQYEPDFLVRLANGVTLIVEIKGLEDEQDRAKHEAANRWISAINNWGKLGTWGFHVNRDPQMLRQEIGWIAQQVMQPQ
ncbi:MAG TPA: DEAD/DEAH box helicase family protein [Anaerolineaceae bacterium]